MTMLRVLDEASWCQTVSTSNARWTDHCGCLTNQSLKINCNLLTAPTPNDNLSFREDLEATRECKDLIS